MGSDQLEASSSISTSEPTCQLDACQVFPLVSHPQEGQAIVQSPDNKIFILWIGIYLNVLGGLPVTIISRGELMVEVNTHL